MSEHKSSKRTEPPGNKDSDSEDDYDVTFSDATQGRFRSRVFEANSQSQFPTAPLYQVNERVYLVVPGRSQPAGPYLVKTILENKRYKLKREDNGQELRDSVEEDDLVVQVAELT